MSGVPNKNKDGIFIYYDNDGYTTNKWHVEIIDGYVNGSLDGYSLGYNILIESTGKFYNVSTDNIKTTTGTNKLTLKLNGTGQVDELVTFISDVDHYILDVGEELKNRISIYKDIAGYINFEVLDKNRKILFYKL